MEYKMKYDESIKVRLTMEQKSRLERLAEKSGEPIASLVRRALDIANADDHVFVPLTVKERQFIEGICSEAGVQPADAVKMVLLSYHTLMSSPLWRIVKPVDEILEEVEGEVGEREGPGEGV